MPLTTTVTRSRFRSSNGLALTFKRLTVIFQIVCVTRQLSICHTGAWTRRRSLRFNLSNLAVAGVLIFGDHQVTQHLCMLPLVPFGVWITFPSKSASTPLAGCE